ncbi:MAG: imidazole glycerol phosphate synthase subunit HisH [Candidatus Omnitrophota bacterium]
MDMSGCEILHHFMKTLVVDYNIGNLQSMVNALKMVGGDVIVSNKGEDFEKASHIVLPGVGAFGEGMKNLEALGLIELLHKHVIEKKKPFLGVCLGMQLICGYSCEGGDYKGLGWVTSKVQYLGQGITGLLIPHVGWNDVVPRDKSVLFPDPLKTYVFYFVHSYHCESESQDVVSSECFYGRKFTASFEHENIFATQFHPEKSQLLGLELLGNFLNYRF